MAHSAEKRASRCQALRHLVHDADAAREDVLGVVYFVAEVRMHGAVSQVIPYMVKVIEQSIRGTACSLSLPHMIEHSRPRGIVQSLLSHDCLIELTQDRFSASQDMESCGRAPCQGHTLPCLAEVVLSYLRKLLVHRMREQCPWVIQKLITIHSCGRRREENSLRSFCTKNPAELHHCRTYVLGLSLGQNLRTGARSQFHHQSLESDHKPAPGNMKSKVIEQFGKLAPCGDSIAFSPCEIAFVNVHQMSTQDTQIHVRHETLLDHFTYPHRRWISRQTISIHYGGFLCQLMLQVSTAS